MAEQCRRRSQRLARRSASSTKLQRTVAGASSTARDEEEAEEAPPPLPLLELPHELLEKAVALLQPCAWGSFARASKAAKALAEGVVGDVVDAEVSRRLVAGQMVGNRLCARQPALEVRAGVTTIGAGAFVGCSSLVSLTLPPSLITIGNSAFHYCSSLTSLTLPHSLTKISYGAFDGCTSLDAESQLAIAAINPHALPEAL